MKSTARYIPERYETCLMEHYLEWAVILQDDDGPDGAIFAIKQYVHFMGKGLENMCFDCSRLAQTYLYLHNHSSPF